MMNVRRIIAATFMAVLAVTSGAATAHAAGGRAGSASASAPASASLTSYTYLTLNQKVAAYAPRMLGIPYRWGGNYPWTGFDCSGLTRYVYAHAIGRSIPRTAETQFHYFRLIAKWRAQPGDLVFFHTSAYRYSYVYHVGIYMGNSRMIVESSARAKVIWQSVTWAGATATYGTRLHG